MQHQQFDGTRNGPYFAIRMDSEFLVSFESSEDTVGITRIFVVIVYYLQRVISVLRIVTISKCVLRTSTSWAGTRCSKQ
jgi:hypothetical protein